MSEMEFILPRHRRSVNKGLNSPLINRKASSVNKVPKQNIVNRTDLAAAILVFLAKFAPVMGDYIGHLPGTGDIIDGLGRERNNASFASVSRSLRRLEKAGKITAYTTSICAVGKGLRYEVRR